MPFHLMTEQKQVKSQIRGHLPSLAYRDRPKDKNF